MSYLDDIYSMTEDTREDNLSWCFAVAHVIFHLTAETEILSEMRYQHSPVCDGVDEEDWPECEIAEAFEDGTVSEAELLEFAAMVNEKDEAFRKDSGE